MFGARTQRHTTRLALFGALCVPLAALGWSSAAAADPVPDVLTVTPSVNPSSFGQDVTYTATLVTPPGSGSLDPGEGIEFQDNGNNITNCNSQPLVGTGADGTYAATCDEPANSLSTGDHTITANFFGDSTYVPNSAMFTQTVEKADTTTTITSPLPGASVTFGDESQLAFNVTVTGVPGANQSPSGEVDVYAGPPVPDNLLCTTFVNGGGGNPSNGNCFINDNTLEAGPYVLTAVYAGDGNYNGSPSASQVLTVEQVETQMQVFAVPGYAFYGAENGNFFIVGVGGNSNNGNATGSVSIRANGVNLVAPGSCPANNGGGNPCYIDSATALPASVTPFPVTLSYPGDANFLPASTSVPLSIFPATSSTVITVSPGSTPYGDEGSLSISATVTSGTTGSPTGTVAVQDGGMTVCTIALRPASSNTSAGSCPKLDGTQLPPGSDALTANYPGDGNFQPSVSSAREPDHCRRRHRGLLGSWLRWGNLLVRNGTVLRLDRRSTPERPDRRHRLDPRRAWLLAGGQGRRGVRVR